MKKLLIDVSDLIGKQVGTSKIVEIAEKIPSLDEENYKIPKKVSGQISLTKIEKGIIGNFQLIAEVELVCVRCLKKFHLPVELKYNQEFSYATAKPLNPDIQYTIYENQVDVLPSIQQEIMLAIPVKPLCNSKCKIKI